ncbi:MAG: hypothetical protein ACI83D_000734 [Planctomycetota bacterium]|jgi:hypothetical protein
MCGKAPTDQPSVLYTRRQPLVDFQIYHLSQKQSYPHIIFELPGNTGT